MTADRMRGRWFFTGDKYSVDTEGFYGDQADRTTCSRRRANGSRRSPSRTACWNTRPVLEAAVVAYVEESSLHTPKAFVVLRRGFYRLAGPGVRDSAVREEPHRAPPVSAAYRLRA